MAGILRAESSLVWDKAAKTDQGKPIQDVAGHINGLSLS